MHYCNGAIIVCADFGFRNTIFQQFVSGLLKVAELLRVKGLVEGEGDKLLNSKNGRPLVSTSMSEPPTSSTKLNGGTGGGEREGTFRGSETGDSRRSSSISAENRERDNSATRVDRENVATKDSPTSGNSGAGQGRLPFMLNPQAVAGMPFPNFPIPGMFPNLLGARDGIHNRVARQDADRDADSANEREGSPSPVSGHKRMKVASGSGGSSSSKESSGMGHRDDQPLVRFAKLFKWLLN